MVTGIYDLRFTIYDFVEPSMNLIINGERHEFPEPSLALSSLILEKLGMKGDRVAVELNREIIRRNQWESTVLKNGDRLEIVHFVGGGQS